MEEIIKMNSIFKKTGAVLVAAALTISGIAYNPVTTKAEEVPLLYEEGTATANTEVTYNFHVRDWGKVYIDFFVPQMVGGMLSFYQNDTFVNTATLTEDATSWQYAETLNAYIYSLQMAEPLPADWKVVLNFNTDTQYAISVSQEKASAVLSQNSITLTKGFTEKLSVSGATGEVVWASSDNSVATVNSAGKVTAKKAGGAKITASTADGQVIGTCTVTVYKNEYNETRRYASSVEYGNSQVQVYKMSYDGKGNLVLKASVLNNRGYRATKIKKLTIKVNDAAGKAVGTFKVKNKKMSLNSGSSKDFKFVIKKSALKNKKADLRTASYKPSGTIIYEVR